MGTTDDYREYTDNSYWSILI